MENLNVPIPDLTEEQQGKGSTQRSELWLMHSAVSRGLHFPEGGIHSFAHQGVLLQAVFYWKDHLLVTYLLNSCDVLPWRLCCLPESHREERSQGNKA
ncbi:unnamed protein product [Coccothraustes coccothraustes]